MKSRAFFGEARCYRRRVSLQGADGPQPQTVMRLALPAHHVRAGSPCLP